MAWYKDPQSGETTKNDFYDKAQSTFSMAQATLLVVPYSTPFKTIDFSAADPWQTLHAITGKDGPNASTMAQEKGYSGFGFDWSGDIKTIYFLPWNAGIKYNDVWDDRMPYTSFVIDTIKDNGEGAPKKPAIAAYKEYVNATIIPNGIHKFRNLSPYINGDSQYDFLRSIGSFSALVEHTPKSNGSEYLSLNTQYSFNKYDILSHPKFSMPYSKVDTSADGTTKSAHFGPSLLFAKYAKGSEYLYVSSDMIVSDNAGTHKPLLKKNSLTMAGYKDQFVQDYNFFLDQIYKNVYDNKSAVEMIMSPSFRDSTFEIKKPFLEKAYAATKTAEEGFASAVNIQSHYNYYLPSYEQAISDYPTGAPDEQISIYSINGSDMLSPFVTEVFIPNIYAMIYDQISEEPSYRYSDQGSWVPLSRWKTEGGKLGLLKENGFPSWSWNVKLGKPQYLEYLSQFLSISTEKKNINSAPVKNIASYLSSWAKHTKFINLQKESGKAHPAWKKYGLHANMSSPFDKVSHKSGAVKLQEKKYNFVGISAYKMKDFTLAANKLKKMFPFYVDIDFPMTNKGFVGDVLFNSGLTDIFMQNVMAASWTVYNDPYELSPTKPIGREEFYKRIKVWTGPVIDKVCVIRKDSAQVETGISAEKDTIFNETLSYLWLNPILEIDFLLDLDSAPAMSSADHSIFAEAFSGLPPQYHSWINQPAAQPFIGQINTVRGLHDAGNYYFCDTTNPVNVLKPIVFGKAPPKTGIANLLKWPVAKAKINKFINDNVRNVVEIYRGKKAYSEVLFYEVVKFRSKHNSASPGYVPDIEEQDQTYTPIGGPSAEPTEKQQGWIQSFLIPNVPGVDFANYVDTQVKHDKGYYYQIYAHTLVIGTRYEQDQFPTKDDLQAWKDSTPENQKDSVQTLSWLYKPDVSLIRVPYYNTISTANGVVSAPENKGAEFSKDYSLSALETTLVWNNPPVFPDATFLPLYGEKNKILINANFNTGEYVLEPSMLKETSQSSWSSWSEVGVLQTFKSRIGQKKLQGPITFKGDDFCGSIEIFRIDKKPTSYQDFMPSSKNLIATVGHGKSNFGFIDSTLEPNKNYYYMVRETDVHKNHSNPSPIYLARIVHKDAEPPYTIFKMFFIEELQDKKETFFKKFMKYIRLQPSLEQRIINEDVLEDYTGSELKNNQDSCFDLSVGINEVKKSVWGKKFKFRFTSKKTGRKFDLNLQVNNIQKLEKDYNSSTGETDGYSSGKC